MKKCKITVLKKTLDEELAKEAHVIITGWNKTELTLEQAEIIEELNSFQENPYPFEELEESWL